MNLLLWITISFITIGFAILISMKKVMENKVIFIKENKEDTGNPLRAKRIIWWIGSATAWGMISIFLAVLCFEQYFG